MTQSDQSAETILPTEKSLLTDAEIVAHLTNNPDFFQRNPDTLESIVIPHETGTAISLVEKQISVLRDKNQSLQEQLNSLITVARDNNDIQQQIHQMAVDVLAANNAETALKKLTGKLEQDFNVKHVAVRLLADDSHPLAKIDQTYVLTSQSARETLDNFTPTDEPLCGRLKATQLKRLFGEQAELITSSAIIPLRRESLHGIIALGSTDEHRFNPGMDTLYLKRLGELIATALLRFID